jgi:acyl-[acyl-carrier-protein]-phospholipid O-acyltransferase/long-chain-fatty-acid--[acyl-carrier-protein] ligase
LETLIMVPPSATPLRSGFAGHLQACIVGAGIDNLFRQVVTGYLVGAMAARYAGQPELGKQAGSSLSSWAMFLFIIPFVLLSPTAGSLGDRLPKHFIIRGARVADVVVCACGVLGLAYGSIPMLLTAIASLGVISAFFAPTKLAVVPELVTADRLGPANAILAALTVMAILGGIGLAAIADPEWVAVSPFATWGPAGTLGAVSLMLCAFGLFGAWKIPPLPAIAPQTPVAMPWAMGKQIKAMSSAPGLWMPSLSLAGFWSLGAVAMVELPTIAEYDYHLGQAGKAGLALVLTVGIIASSLLAPRYMARAFPAGLPIAGAAIAGICLSLAGWLAQPQGDLLTFALLLLGCGFGAGFWEVSLTILVQERAPAARRNLVMAGTSLLSSLGTILAVVVVMALTEFAGGTAEVVFILLGAGTCLLALACAIHYRKQVAGWLITLLLKLAYRVQVIGAEHVPATGGCLVVCNHLGYTDGAILAASLPRPGRFLVYRHFVEMPVIGFFLRAAGVIPVAAEDHRRALLASIDAAVEAAKAGEVVVIFPEGKLTRSGQTDVFHSGLERIASRAGVPIIPAHLDGLYGTIASRSAHWLFPRPLRPVTLRIGAPLPATTDAATARSGVMDLGYQAAQTEADHDRRTLGQAALARARRHPLATCVIDSQGRLSMWQAMACARALVSRLGLAADEKRVGIMLPPGRAGTLVNLALALDGRTAVNLNHSAGSPQVAGMAAMAGVRTVISAAAYLKRIGNPVPPGRTVLVEDELSHLSRIRLLWCAIENLLLPGWIIDRARADDVAAIIFSSGSTGDPKGVQLTHRQILANCRATSRALNLEPFQDVLLSPLPLFHSFGLVPGMWLGLVDGLTVAAHPDPRDGEGIGRLCATARATFSISTPSFVRGWMRRVPAEQLKTLRFAVVGAERCPAELRAEFKAKYGADLLEGYGCTELAPVVAINLLTVERDHEREVRSRDGSVGRALPGVQVIVVDPDTHQPLPPGADGLLVVKSPARMLGYLDRPDLTDQAFILGGYNTGDIGQVDAEGFIRITGRLARFAKVAGEMVPLDNVEAALQAALRQACPESTAELAMASVNDATRGERLVVLHTGIEADPATLLPALDAFPALWRPKAGDFRKVAEIPKLGTGKRDLGALRLMAAQVVG